MNKKFVDAKYVMNRYDIDMVYLCQLCDENKILCYNRIGNNRVYSSTHLYSEPKFERSNYIYCFNKFNKKVISFGIEFNQSKNIDMLIFHSFDMRLTDAKFYIKQNEINRISQNRNVPILSIELNEYDKKNILEKLNLCDKISVEIIYGIKFEDLVDFSSNREFKKIDIQANKNNKKNLEGYDWDLLVKFLEYFKCNQITNDNVCQSKFDEPDEEKGFRKLVTPKQKKRYLDKMWDGSFADYLDLMKPPQNLDVKFTDQDIDSLDIDFFLDEDNRIAMKIVNSKFFMTCSNYSYQAGENAKLIFTNKSKEMHDYAEFLTCFDREYYLSKENDTKLIFKKDYFIFNFEIYEKLKYPKSSYDEAIVSFSDYFYSLQFDFRQVNEYFMENRKLTQVDLDKLISFWEGHKKKIDCKSEIYKIVDIYIDRLKNQTTYLELFRLHKLNMSLEKIQKNDENINENSANRAISRLIHKLEEYAISNGFPFCSQETLKLNNLMKPKKTAPRRENSKKAEGKGNE